MMRLLLIPPMVLAAILLVGCERVTAENYQKLEVGMPYDEIVSILGEPSECDAVVNTKSCRWGTDDKHVEAKIVGESVIFLSAKGLK